MNPSAIVNASIRLAGAAGMGNEAECRQIVSDLAREVGLPLASASGVTLIPANVRWVRCPQLCQTGPDHYNPFLESNARNPDDSSRPWSTVIGLPDWFEGIPGMIVEAKRRGIVADDPIKAERRPDPAATPGTDTDGCGWYKAAPTNAQWEQIARALIAAPGFLALYPDWTKRAPRAVSVLNLLP